MRLSALICLLLAATASAALAHTIPISIGNNDRIEVIVNPGKIISGTVLLDETIKQTRLCNFEIFGKVFAGRTLPVKKLVKHKLLRGERVMVVRNPQFKRGAVILYYSTSMYFKGTLKIAGF